MNEFVAILAGLCMVCTCPDMSGTLLVASQKMENNHSQPLSQSHQISMTVHTTCGDPVPYVDIDILLPGSTEIVRLRTDAEGSCTISCQVPGTVVAVASNGWDRCDRHFYFSNQSDEEVEFLFEC